MNQVNMACSEQDGERNAGKKWIKHAGGKTSSPEGADSNPP